MKRIYITIIALLIAGIFCEIFSVLLFYGLFWQLYPICGSACEIWPGIPTSLSCILICVSRNGFYPLFFAFGVILITIGITLIIIEYMKPKSGRNKTLEISLKEGKG